MEPFFRPTHDKAIFKQRLPKAKLPLVANNIKCTHYNMVVPMKRALKLLGGGTRAHHTHLQSSLLEARLMTVDWPGPKT